MSQKNGFVSGTSVYTGRLEDSQAVYLIQDNFPVKADGVGDDTDAIQMAIYKAQEKCRFGIVFIPEGRYRISKTIYIGKGMRLIGYGKNRPVIVLGKNSPGFQSADSNDKGQANYMFWFTDRAPLPGEQIKDAGAGTFYSALSNIDLKIEDGNPAAVALRTHYAQHSFISHVDIDIGEGKAGIFDVGNEIEDVRFFGGDYGIYTTKPSPGWPFMMVDTYFEGQRKAAIKTRQAGLTIVRMNVKNVPAVVETDPHFYEKLYMKDCQFENISGPAIVISNEFNPINQINLRNVDCNGVQVLASYRESGKIVEGMSNIYKVETFVHGNHIDELGSRAEIKTTIKMVELQSFPAPMQSDIPKFPDVETWVNIKDLGAKGDGTTDDTDAIKEAIEKYRILYVPQGWYRVLDTVTLKPDTVLIGLNPIATQFVLEDNTEAFGGFGLPKPLLETPKGGTNIVSGIGLDAGGRNPRAVGCKWMAGSDSYMNDVKFIGGHGSMSTDGSFVALYNEGHSCDANLNRKWDSQYWSLWITDGGGGTFKDIWTASPYAAAGMYISDTSTAGRIYAMSVEHHVRSEVKFKNVSNWDVFALQLEEEVAEGRNCQPLEIENCSNLMFANLYLFRVIWHVNPYPYAIKSWNSKDIEMLNVHNYSQIKYTIDNTLFDVNTNTELRQRQIARLYISGKAPLRHTPATAAGAVQKLAGGFEFIDAVCADSRGNIYFSDSRWKRIYQWSVERNSLRIVTDIPFKPLSLACDKDDNLLVVIEYFPPKGAMIGGKPEVYPKPEDSSGTSYGYWYNVGSTIKVYAIQPDRPETSMQILQAVPMESVKKVYKALHPANRWRDSGDYLKVAVNRARECYVAPDGVTIIPMCYDLMRANSLLGAYPGKPFFAVDEYNKRTVLFDVSPEGYLLNPNIFAERGENNIAVDTRGNVYIPDGEIYVYDMEGELKDQIDVPERPSCIIFGSDGRNELYITARSSLYMVNTCDISRC
jgi:sugar lactone lactonase YvrE